MTGHGTGHNGRTSLSSWAAASLVILSAVAAVAAAVVLSGRQHELAASAGRRAAIPSGTATLLRLSPAPAGAAPGFTLTDQDGRVLSLSGFRGRAVVLEFMDSRCTGICPLVSREFIDAYHVPGQQSGASRVLLIGTAVLTVVLSWTVINSAYTLRYADQHFRSKPGGIEFGTEDGQQHPSYLDFAYVAFTIGMCYQVSDTTLRDPLIRRTAFAHALLSYVFGVVIVAGSVNLISGLFR